MKLFHITKEKYLPEILTNGLIINSGKCGFCKKEVHKSYKEKYGMQPIFLTNDIGYIIKTMLTDNWIVKNKIIILEVFNIKLSDENSSSGWVDENTMQPKEFRYYNNILPNNIKISNYG